MLCTLHHPWPHASHLHHHSWPHACICPCRYNNQWMVLNAQILQKVIFYYYSLPGSYLSHFPMMHSWGRIAIPHEFLRRSFRPDLSVAIPPPPRPPTCRVGPIHSEGHWPWPAMGSGAAAWNHGDRRSQQRAAGARLLGVIQRSVSVGGTFRV